jgi:serine/threonine protein kinase
MNPSCSPFLRRDDFEFIGVLGAGGDGRVDHVREKHHPFGEFARKTPIRGAEMWPQLRELEVLTSIDHPSVLRLKGVIVPSAPGDVIQVILPYMANGSLDKVLPPDPPREWDATAVSKAIFGVVAGMAYLHDKGIHHRDLKPANILLNESFEPVICDFARARFTAVDVSVQANTPRYSPPEWLERRFGEMPASRVFPGDVYSFAVILVDLFDVDKTRRWVYDGNVKRTVIGR